MKLLALEIVFYITEHIAYFKITSVCEYTCKFCRLKKSIMYFIADLSLAVPVTNALTLVFTAVAGKLTGEDVGLSIVN